VAQALGDHYKPKSFSVVARLPRTTVGKIDKKALRAAYLAEAGDDIADDGRTAAPESSAGAACF
jgi:acyl-coenzyme A synthetase/AMP-(fatty) acid ligase